MEPEILKVTLFNGEGNAVAAVKLGYGPITIHTKLYRTEKDKFFLSMPSRYSEAQETWFKQCDIEDRRVYSAAVDKAVSAYQDTVARQQLQLAAV